MLCRVKLSKRRQPLACRFCLGCKVDVHLLGEARGACRVRKHERKPLISWEYSLTRSFFGHHLSPSVELTNALAREECFEKSFFRFRK